MKYNKVIDTRLNLFEEYWKELSIYDITMRNEEPSEVRQFAFKYIVDEHCQWLDVLEGGKIVGFLIVADNASEESCHPYTDYTICQAFVSCGYRNQGYMSDKVLSFLHTHRGTYSLDVIRGNHSARHFWIRIFDMVRAERIKIEEVRRDVDQLELLGFSVR